MNGADSQRSVEACPECGVHQLTLLHRPQFGGRGARPFDEIVGMGDINPNEPPGIGCQACGAEWPDLEAFRRAQRRDRQP
jgi:hypothetical protein